MKYYFIAFNVKLFSKKVSVVLKFIVKDEVNRVNYVENNSIDIFLSRVFNAYKSNTIKLL